MFDACSLVLFLGGKSLVVLPLMTHPQFLYSKFEQIKQCALTRLYEIVLPMCSALCLDLREVLLYLEGLFTNCPPPGSFTLDVSRTMIWSGDRRDEEGA